MTAAGSLRIVVREATDADLPAVLGLYRQPDMDGAAVLSFDAARAIFREFQRYPSYRLFVACEEGESAVVGSYALLLMHNLAHRGARSAIAEDVVVAADRQGRGIGRRLMAHALAETRAAGGYKLALSSNRRRTAAHAFYRSLGFVQHGLSFVVEA